VNGNKEIRLLKVARVVGHGPLIYLAALFKVFIQFKVADDSPRTAVFLFHEIQGRIIEVFDGKHMASTAVNCFLPFATIGRSTKILMDKKGHYSVCA
jgi:hypothetical protein